MMKKGRIFTAILILILCLSYMVPAAANPYLTTRRGRCLKPAGYVKGDSLGIISLKTLLRSEAAAFIVRLWGRKTA